VRLRIFPCAKLSLILLGAAALGPACLNWGALENGACGDGFVGREEACDDGNRISGDGCSDTCHIEPVVCGDGRKAPSEDCDDANALNNDACVEGCGDAKCGDGFVYEVEEQCDDGNTDDGDGCSMGCTLETAVLGPSCGDGELDSDEACDDGNMSDADSCLKGCSWATCGDGRVRSGVEECDDGAATKIGGCTRGCMLCGDGKDSYFRAGNAHCYSLHADAATEQQAREACQSEAGDLWTITSEAESSDVIDKLALSGRYWLGLLVSNAGGNWVSGENIKYTSFAAGEPSDLALRCVALDAMNASGAWSSAACASKLGFICERSPAFVFPIDHHAYRLHTGVLAAAAARARCTEDGGHLAALETDLERMFVGKNVGIAAWLDASDSAVENQFVWPNGDKVDTSAFAAGQPDDTTASEGCLLFNPGDKFADAACSEPHAYICEFD
jgi:cysteine-rich repeat protein